MYTLSTARPLPTEATPIPLLVIGGQSTGNRATISLDYTTLPVEYTHWPEFHNGVAAGLRLAPGNHICSCS